MKYPRSTFYGPNSIPATALQKQAIAKRQLDYAEGTDVFNSTAATTSAWTTILAAQNFTVDLPDSLVLFTLRLGMQIINGASNNAVTTRLLLDGATQYQVGLAGITASGVGAVNGGVAYVTGLTPGTHTVAVQYWAINAGTLFLRTSTVPNTEFLGLQVVELRRGA